MMTDGKEAGLAKKKSKRPLLLALFLTLCLGISLAVGLILHFQKPKKSDSASRTEALVDCHPDPDPTKEKCERRKCLWRVFDDQRTPNCTFTPDTIGYNITGSPQTTKDGGMKILLKRHGAINTIFEQSVYENMNVEIQQYTETALRIKFYPDSVYYEISNEALSMSSPEPVVNPQYTYNFTGGPQFGIVVTRIGNGTTVYNSRKIIYSNYTFELLSAHWHWMNALFWNY